CVYLYAVRSPEPCTSAAACPMPTPLHSMPARAVYHGRSLPDAYTSTRYAHPSHVPRPQSDPM
ncbi:unnamed protein product, partial [Musa textilis]